MTKWPLETDGSHRRAVSGMPPMPHVTALPSPARAIAARDILPSFIVAVGLLFPGAVDVAGPYLDLADFPRSALRSAPVGFLRRFVGPQASRHFPP